MMLKTLNYDLDCNIMYSSRWLKYLIFLKMGQKFPMKY